MRGVLALTLYVCEIRPFQGGAYSSDAIHHAGLRVAERTAAQIGSHWRVLAGPVIARPLPATGCGRIARRPFGTLPLLKRAGPVGFLGRGRTGRARRLRREADCTNEHRPHGYVSL